MAMEHQCKHAMQGLLLSLQSSGRLECCGKSAPACHVEAIDHATDPSGSLGCHGTSMPYSSYFWRHCASCGSWHEKKLSLSAVPGCSAGQPVSWLDVSQHDMVLAPNASDTIHLTYNADGLPAGTYRAQLCLFADYSYGKHVPSQKSAVSVLF